MELGSLLDVGDCLADDVAKDNQQPPLTVGDDLPHVSVPAAPD